MTHPKAARHDADLLTRDVLPVMHNRVADLWAIVRRETSPAVRVRLSAVVAAAEGMLAETTAVRDELQAEAEAGGC